MTDPLLSASPAAGRTPSPQTTLAAAGLDPQRATRRLEDAGLWGDDGPAAGTLDLVAAVSDAAAPDDALRVLTELATAHPGAFAAVRADPGWLARVVAVAGASRPLGDLLARHPDALDGLRAPSAVDAAAVAEEVDAAVTAAGDDQAARARAVATIRRRVTAAVAARDLADGADVEQVGRDLARLADGVLAGTLAAIHRAVAGDELTTRFCVVGMGKLGGEELNYVSDIDVVFVHEPPADGDDGDARREAQAVCSLLLQVLNASTTMGRAYEVDPSLRPEGRDGPLSRTLTSFVSYWERWAEPWEFQALLKARPVAGDLDLGRRLLAAAEPFVFPERLEARVVDEVRRMKSRVEAKQEVLRHGDRQLKLGPGGLRDIEFSVQLLQLVHGRADRSLRAGGTLPALAALARGGYVAEDDAAAFADAYRELRRVEHRLQLADERRTHTLPDHPGALERIARSLGYRPQLGRPAHEAFVARLRALQAEVRDLHAKLFYRPLLELHAAVPASDAALVAGDGPVGLDETAAVTRVEALGFRDGRGAIRDVRALTAGVSRRATTLRAVLPAMLHVLSESPDPDAGLRGLRTLIEAQSPDSTLVATLRDQPPAAQLLARMLGTSEVLGELLAAQPQSVELLADGEARVEPRTRTELVRAALALLGWQEGLEGRQAALRRFKRRELLRIALRDLAGEATVASVGAELAALGEACLQGGLAAVLADRREGPLPARVAIVGMGKLGGAELHYPSDLDVVFVHAPDGGADDDEAAAFAVDVAERVLTALSAVTREGTAFEVDAELRPEGRSGPLSRSLASCHVYYERWAEPWEHQALLKARHVAGDADLGRAFVALAAEHAYPEVFGEDDAKKIRMMKARIERERVPRRADPGRHLKLGPGGLADVEWCVQLLQRRDGRRDPRLRTTSTLTAIDALRDAGTVEQRDAAWLADGYRFLSEVRNRLYLLRERDVDSLPASAPAVERLARSLGYGRGGRQAFEDDYRRMTRRVRRVVERVFYGQD